MFFCPSLIFHIIQILVFNENSVQLCFYDFIFIFGFLFRLLLQF